MKIVDKTTGETLATITTNHRMSLEEACDLCGIKLMKTQQDYEQENGYDIDQIDLVD